MSSDRGRCLEAGCDEYLSKPVDRARLIELVSQFLAERKSDGDS
jgi:CheY-like chemotaxis protein